MSDNKAVLRKADWLPENEIGYLIHSYFGKVEFVAKTNIASQIQLELKGLDIRDPENRKKRIPYWIDYTNLTVNGKVIFDKLTPAWHNKSYPYNMEVKAGEEITVNVEWLPHRSDTVKEVALPQPALTRNTPQEEKLIASEQKLKAQVEMLLKKTSELEKYNADYAQLIHNLSPYITARVDIKLMTTEGDIQILSVSDDKAKVSKPGWFQNNGIGYVITSYSGKLSIVAKATVDGQILLTLRGLDIRNADRSKHVPYWVDYTALTVNENTIIDKLTPVWHNKPYHYNTDVKADEEITVTVEWLPHRSDN